jgi:serine/threonine-protein kinase RsbW
MCVPARLERRDLVVVAVTTACGTAAAQGRPCDSRFVNELVSAVGEAFNNIVIHGHAGAHGWVELAMSADDEAIVAVLRDTGASFDLRGVPELEELGRHHDVGDLRESGMGVFIIRSFVDEVDYWPGEPNCLVLKKRFAR